MTNIKSILYGLLGVVFLALLALPWLHTPTAPVAHAAPPVVAAVKVERFASDLQSANVKVLLDKGHGSAVHIGNGAFLTAAHVIANPSKRLDIKLADKSIRKAEVLWIAKDYDIALLRADGRDIAVSALTCSMPKVGDDITLTGNPMALEDITSFGRIAGDERTLAHWKSVLVVSAPTIPGQSGGAVYDRNNRVVGITVGLMGVSLSMFPAPSGYGAIVPSKTICGLLGRTA